MQNLNTKGGRNENGEAHINFYSHGRHDTEQSAGPAADVYYEKNRVEQEPSDQMESQDVRSRNIMNQGQQLSLMTECSDILDCSAGLILENLKEDSQAS